VGLDAEVIAYLSYPRGSPLCDAALQPESPSRSRRWRCVRVDLVHSAVDDASEGARRVRIALVMLQTKAGLQQVAKQVVSKRQPFMQCVE